MKPVMVLTIILSGIHMLLGLVSMSVGVSASIQAEVWMAHSVSPIWSGGFFFVTGILGVTAAKGKSDYIIMCFSAGCIVSLVTAVVNIQLLRLGLVNHTTDGNTYQKEHKDVLILIALGAAGIEILFCLFSSLVSFRLRVVAKKEKQNRHAETFHVQVLGQKDILVVSKWSKYKPAPKAQTSI